MEAAGPGHPIFRADGAGFEERALEIFRFQYAKNPLYQSYVNALGTDPFKVSSLTEIPFLPIHFFKSHAVKTTEFKPAIVFESSGTSGQLNSQHAIKDLSIYEKSFVKAFEIFYGSPEKYCILGLLPSYLERTNSSLVYMVDKLIGLSRHSKSGFYLHDHERLFGILKKLELQNQKTILIGVSFALLDLAEKFRMELRNTVIIETGGMKGRRKEMVRPELHQILKESFKVSSIHSEYGMTELLSQAYSKGEGIFHCAPWMKVMARDEDDPLESLGKTDSGALNIIDLANIYSCSFIATDDLGKTYPDGSFEVIGRMDGSDLRGCSLMIV